MGFSDGHVTGGGEVGVAQPDALDDAPVHLLGEGPAGDLLDDQAGQHVVRVAVLPFRPGGEAGLVLEGDVEEVAGFEVPDVVAEVCGVVGKPAGVLEELTDGDAASVDALPADEPRQIGVDRGVETDLPFTDQLQHDHRGEHLGVAADPHLTVPRHLRAGGQVAHPRGVGTGAARTVLDARQRSGQAIGAHQRAQALLDGIRAGGSGRRGRRQDTHRHHAHGHRGRGRNGSAPAARPPPGRTKPLPCLLTHGPTPKETWGNQQNVPGPAFPEATARDDPATRPARVGPAPGCAQPMGNRGEQQVNPALRHVKHRLSPATDAPDGDVIAPRTPRQSESRGTDATTSEAE